MTRRELLKRSSAGALLAGLALIVGPEGMLRAGAQTISSAELMAPGPLPEQVLGAADAPVTIIEYASMTCSHCADFHNRTYPALKERYIDTGKVRYILREFPLDPLATAAFMLARCAGENRYFPLVEALFRQQREWAFQRQPLEPLRALARQAGFTEQTFNACLTNQKLQTDVEQVRDRAATKFGVNSTPTFFINGEMTRGALSIEELEKKIRPYLKS
jgi:protein-disulfide isomerase